MAREFARVAVALPLLDGQDISDHVDDHQEGEQALQATQAFLFTLSITFTHFTQDFCKTVVLYTHFTPKGPYIKNDRNLGGRRGVA